MEACVVAGFLSGMLIGQAALTLALMLLANLNRNDNGGE